MNRGDDSIKRVNTAGTVVETVFSDPDRLDSGIGLELDYAENIIYWSNFGTMDGIYRVDTDGSGFGVILGGADVSYPYGIALDEVNGVIYWAEGSSIRKADTDGTGIADVITAGITTPIGLFYHDDILYITDIGESILFAYSDTLVELDDDYIKPADIEIWDME
jgi:hypothetical protein